MLQECARQRGLSVALLNKKNNTNIGLVTATVLAFILEYPKTTLFIVVFGGIVYSATCVVSCICLHLAWICNDWNHGCDEFIPPTWHCDIYLAFAGGSCHHFIFDFHIDLSSYWTQYQREVTVDCPLCFPSVYLWCCTPPKNTKANMAGSHNKQTTQITTTILKRENMTSAYK